MKKQRIFILIMLCLITAVLTASAGETTLISFVGDISIGDNNGSGGYHTCIETNGYAWPFSLVVEELGKDDLTVGNLEVVLTERRNHSTRVYNLRGKPEFTECLKLGSIEVVNTVNNHCEDYFVEGYDDTLEALRGAGIGYFGSSRFAEGEKYDNLLIRDMNGIRFGFIGISYPHDSDLKRISNRIARLREQGCDIVIVSLHWGKETHTSAESGQAIYAKQIIDMGADMIYGHHAHVIQQVQFYNGKPILFNTGNFTFGTISDLPSETGIFQCQWERAEDGVDLKMFRVIPCRTQKGPDFRPYIVTDEADRAVIFKRLWRKNAPKGLVNLPESFLETGTAYLDHGEFVTEQGN